MSIGIAHIGPMTSSAQKSAAARLITCMSARASPSIGRTHRKDAEARDHDEPAALRRSPVAAGSRQLMHAAQESPTTPAQKTAERECGVRSTELETCAREGRWTAASSDTATASRRSRNRRPRRATCGGSAPRAPPRALAGARRRQTIELARGDRRMFRGVVAEVPPPRRDPHETATPEDDERSAPGDEGDEPRDDGRRDGVAAARERVRDSRAKPRRLGASSLHRAGGDGKGRAFAEAEEDTDEEQRSETASESGQNRGPGPDHPADEQRASRTHSIAKPSAEHLKQDIRIGEGREDKSELRVRETELTSDLTRRGRDVHAIDVGDQVHQAQQAKNRFAGGRPSESHFASWSRQGRVQ